jgi:hypothetical protein
MKNIHIIPTDKPSRLCYDKDDNLLFAPNSGFTIADGKQNIYITNDEKIKDGDSYINGKYLYKADRFYTKAEFDKKIILTDNKDLIKDGIQPIDNEFLEWFVNNPCERVEVKSESSRKFGMWKPEYYPKIYKIIIPQEEHKQSVQEYEQQGLEKYSYELKQETLEEDDLDSIENKIIECLNKADNKLNANDFNRLAESIINYIDEISRNKSY